MSKPRYPNRYIVYHSAIGYIYCNTLKEARRIVEDVEKHSSYSPCIYDDLRKERVL